MGCGCLLSPIRWLFHAGWKGWLLVAFVVLLVVIGYCTIKNTIEESQKENPVVTTIPSKAEAPYLVQTDSRYYYAKEVIKDGDNYILKLYWSFDGKKWVLHAGELTLGEQFNVKVGKQ